MIKRTDTRAGLPAGPYLCGLYAFCLQALRTLDDVELNRLALLKAAEAIILKSGLMNENVRTRCTRNEAEALALVEPLDCPCFHDVLPVWLMYR